MTTVLHGLLRVPLRTRATDSSSTEALHVVHLLRVSAHERCHLQHAIEFLPSELHQLSTGGVYSDASGHLLHHSASPSISDRQLA